MPSRVGMTTNPEERKAHWQANVHGFSNWRIVLRGLTYNQAHAKEMEYRGRGYVGHQGGSPKTGNNYVIYTFDYTREK